MLIYRMKEKLKFDINTLFDVEAKQIFSARERSFTMHKASNIDAAGDEIEIRVRDIIKQHLPVKYHVTQGHIVDSELSLSNQIDVIIADNNGSAVLFRSENNTEYLTFESIYAIGEIKSTYYKSKDPIKDFISKIKYINENLTREKTSINQINQNLTLKGEGIKIEETNKRPYRNPIFKFIFFVDSGDLNISEINESLMSEEKINVPNIICFLDKGVILLSEINPLVLPHVYGSAVIEIKNGIPVNVYQEELPRHWVPGKVEYYPEFIEKLNSKNYSYVFYEFEGEKHSASILANLTYALNSHLNSCLVLRPNLTKYHEKLFKVSKTTILNKDFTQLK